jgi:hypothetical protein
MKLKNGEMSERQAARIIEMYENASRNGEQWAHDVFLHRGTDKYEDHLNKLNEAFGIKSIPTVVKPLKAVAEKQRASVNIPRK